MVSPVQASLERLHKRFAGITGGQVETCIPELAKADTSAFGIVIATVDGRVDEVGSTRLPFTLQSISKPLVRGVALEDRASERVEQAIGVEPSGEAFNSISLEPGTGSIAARRDADGALAGEIAHLEAQVSRLQTASRFESSNAPRKTC